MSNDDVEQLIAREDTPPQQPVEEVLDAQRDEAASGIGNTAGPFDLMGDSNHPGISEEAPALADLINNTGDDGGASSG